MPSTALIASGTDAEICSAPDCTFSAAPESPRKSSSPESRRLCTVCGRSCRKSRTLPTSGTSSSSPSSTTSEGGAEHGHGRGKAAGQVGLRHHEAHRVLEDEPEEDPDEHDQEGVADRHECGEHSDRSGDEEHRPHREDELDAPTVAVVHASAPESSLAIGSILVVGGGPSHPHRRCPRWKRPRPLAARSARFSCFFSARWAFCSATLTLASP